MASVKTAKLGQTLRITLNTFLDDLASATVKKISYRKPDGTTGQWDASILDTTKLSYKITAGVIDKLGIWIFETYVEIGAEIYPGDEYPIRVIEKIETT